MEERNRRRAQTNTSQLQNMLTWGGTTVFNIASVVQNTNVIRHRIGRGEVEGPRILTVGPGPLTLAAVSLVLAAAFASRYPGRPDDRFAL